MKSCFSSLVSEYENDVDSLIEGLTSGLIHILDELALNLHYHYIMVPRLWIDFTVRDLIWSTQNVQKTHNYPTLLEYRRLRRDIISGKEVLTL